MADPLSIVEDAPLSIVEDKPQVSRPGFFDSAYGNLIDTVKGLYDTAKGYPEALDDAQKSFSKGDYGKSALHMTKWLLGPAERVADNLVGGTVDQVHKLGSALADTSRALHTGDTKQATTRLNDAFLHGLGTTLPPPMNALMQPEEVRENPAAYAGKGVVQTGLTALTSPAGLEGVQARAESVLREGAEQSYKKMVGAEAPKGSSPAIVAANKARVEAATEALVGERPVASSLQSMIDKVDAKTRQVGVAAGTAFHGKGEMPIAPAIIQLEKQRLNATRPTRELGSPPPLSDPKAPFGYGAEYQDAAPANDLIRAHQRDFFDNAYRNSKGVPVVDARTFDEILNRTQNRNVGEGGKYTVSPNPTKMSAINGDSASLLKDLRDAAFPAEKAGQEAYGKWNSADELLKLVQNKRELNALKSKVMTVGGLLGGAGSTAFALHHFMNVPVQEAGMAGVALTGGLQGLYKTLNSVPWRSVSGATKAALADNIAKGDWGKVATQLQVVRASLAPQDQQENNQ